MARTSLEITTSYSRDFNFVDSAIDKGEGTDARDRIISLPWETVKSEVNLHDPFRVQFPTKVAYSLVAPAGKSRGERIYVNEETAGGYPLCAPFYSL